MLAAEDAAALVEGLLDAGVRCWVMGGWGVDALLGYATRPHHDLDLFVAVHDLPAAVDRLRDLGFVRAHEWEENRTVAVRERLCDTAFVERHPDGREVDVHGLHVGAGRARPAAADPWDLPDGALDAVGEIAGRPVPCVTADAQRALHRGYELPGTHLEDLRRLAALATPPRWTDTAEG